MRPGGCSPKGSMAAARADPLTESVAQILASEEERLLVEFVDVALADPPPPTTSLYAAYATKVHPTQVLALASVRDAVANWIADLTAAEVGRRKGAVLERVVELMLTTRLGMGNVERECAVTFSDGTSSLDFDVFGRPATGRWEGVECKWSRSISQSQADSLALAAKRSMAEGGGLLVAVVSTKSRKSIEHVLRWRNLCGLVMCVGIETIFRLRSGTEAYGHCTVANSE